MSLESLKMERKELREDKAKLTALKTALSTLKGDVSKLVRIFKEASESIAHAGEINGGPFDGGNTEEYAGVMEKTTVAIEGAIQSVGNDITKIEQRLYIIDIEIDKELARLSNTDDPKKTQTPRNNKSLKNSKIIYNTIQ